MFLLYPYQNKTETWNTIQHEENIFNQKVTVVHGSVKMT